MTNRQKTGAIELDKQGRFGKDSKYKKILLELCFGIVFGANFIINKA